MRRALRQPLAVAFALLVVTVAALGGAFVFNDDVQTLEGASGQYVQRGAAFSPSDGLILGYASGAIETYQSFIGSNQPTDDLQKADWQETWKEIYQAHVTQAGNNDAQLSVMENYLEDTKSIALMQGKKAYVRKLNNGATKGDATLAAQEAIENYYLVKQENLLSMWDANMMVINNSLPRIQKDPIYIWDSVSHSSPSDVRTTSVSLIDGSSAQTYEFQDADSGNWKDPTDIGGNAIQIHGPDNTNLPNELVLNGTRFYDAWSAVQTQNNEVQNQISSFIDATYSDYQAGSLNASDFVDPYMGARSYSPETSDTWTMRTLSSMGVTPPENVSSIGLMNVSHEGTTYRGVLMSDGTPTNGYAVNTTYNTSTIAGPQWVALEDGGSHKLDGEFTLQSATRKNGTAYTENETIGYSAVNYTTSNMTELKELNSQLRELQAQIDARQQRLRNSGGVGWLPDFGGLNVGSVAPVVLIAGGALVLLGRN